MKVNKMRTRLLDVNPKCNVEVVYDVVTEDNARKLVLGWKKGVVTVCIDAIDGITEKAALIWACVNEGVPVITCGGAMERII